MMSHRLHLFQFLHKYASPPYFYGFAGRLIPWLAGVAALLLGWGLYQGLFVAPPDYQQGEACASCSSTCQRRGCRCSCTWSWPPRRGGADLEPEAGMIATACAPIGASFTFLALDRVTVGASRPGAPSGPGTHA